MTSAIDWDLCVCLETRKRSAMVQTALPVWMITSFDLVDCFFIFVFSKLDRASGWEFLICQAILPNIVKMRGIWTWILSAAMLNWKWLTKSDNQPAAVEWRIFLWVFFYFVWLHIWISPVVCVLAVLWNICPRILWCRELRLQRLLDAFDSVLWTWWCRWCVLFEFAQTWYPL